MCELYVIFACCSSVGCEKVAPLKNRQLITKNAGRFLKSVFLKQLNQQELDCYREGRENLPLVDFF